MIEEKIQKGVDLSSLTTFKIGGLAKYFIEIDHTDELLEAVRWAKDAKERIYVLGGGSNLLVNDQGVNGLVIILKNKEVKVMGERLNCAGGASLAYAISISRQENLGGLEWGFGIPMATIGGSVRGNAGAFGEDMSSSVETVEAFNIEKEHFQFFSNKDCRFNYRSSIFKTNPIFVIWGVTLKLKKVSSIEINKKIENNFEHRNNSLPRLPSAGSVFKNILLEDIKRTNEQLAVHLLENGKVKGGKVGAGALIDMLGFKGRVIGGAKVSLEHANFIVNTGRATARDVLDLIECMHKEVKERFNVELEPEVQLIGFE